MTQRALTLTGALLARRPGGIGPTVRFSRCGSGIAPAGPCLCGAAHRWRHMGHAQWLCEGCGRVWRQTFERKAAPAAPDLRAQGRARRSYRLRVARWRATVIRQQAESAVLIDPIDADEFARRELIRRQGGWDELARRHGVGAVEGMYGPRPTR